MPINAEQFGELKKDGDFQRDLKSVYSVLTNLDGHITYEMTLHPEKNTEENLNSAKELHDIVTIFENLNDDHADFYGGFGNSARDLARTSKAAPFFENVTFDGKPVFQCIIDFMEAKGFKEDIPEFKQHLVNLNSSMQLGLENTKLKNDLPELGSKVKEDGLEDLQRMFSTRTRRLYVNSPEYNRAKLALDRYVEARKNGNVPADTEKELRTAMNIYVDKVSNHGTKSIDQMSHGYGAARLAAGRGVLDFLDKEANIQKEEELVGIDDNDNAREKANSEKVKELKYIELYNKQYGEIRTQEGQDRRKRAADHALEETRKEARKGPEIEAPNL